MKSKFYLVFASLVLLFLQVSAQAPNFFNYQGVARDASGAVLANQKISLKFTIHQATTFGAEVYSETQSDSTNQFGLFTAVIGSGTPITGSIATITWGTDNYYLQVEMDVNGGSAYIDFGAEQLLSVPYALYAQSANSANNKYVAGKGIIINDSLISAQVTAQNVAGAGITVNDSLISAQNTVAIWNANELEGSAVSLDPPSTGNVLQWDGAEWEPTTPASTASNGWNLTGNAGTTYTSNYIGTTDDQGVAFEMNGQIAGRLEDGGLYNGCINNTSFGVGALQDVDDVYNYGPAGSQGYNVAIGYIALQDNIEGNHNTGVGAYTLQLLTYGNNNTSVGGDALYQVTGSGNTGMGFDCMELAQSGNFNTASGYYALYNSSGSGGMASNTAIGSYALYNNYVSQNVAVGDSALANNYGGTGNTALGYMASDNNQYGNNNTSVGYQALSNDFGGTGNTALGYNANVSGTLSNATAIGANALVNANNTVQLGSGCSIQFDQALMPAGDPGTSGATLQSNGAGAAPTWVAAGTLPITVSATSVDLSVTPNTYSVLITADGQIVTLPAASSFTGKIYVIVAQMASGSVTISSFNNLNGVATTSIISGSSITIQSDGTNWDQIR